jgi:hypothetical protein
VLKYWQDIDAFKKQLKLSEGKPLYTFYDGPPFATGLPHYGHIAAGTIKVSFERDQNQSHLQLIMCSQPLGWLSICALNKKWLLYNSSTMASASLINMIKSE